MRLPSPAIPGASVRTWPGSQAVSPWLTRVVCRFAGKAEDLLAEMLALLVGKVLVTGQEGAGLQVAVAELRTRDQSHPNTVERGPWTQGTSASAAPRILLSLAQALLALSQLLPGVRHRQGPALSQVCLQGALQVHLSLLGAFLPPASQSEQLSGLPEGRETQEKTGEPRLPPLACGGVRT